MFFGAQAFSSAPFAGEFVQKGIVNLTGNGLNIAIGNIRIVNPIDVTGNQINLASGTVSVVSWTPIPPGATQVWVPIDPNDP